MRQHELYFYGYGYGYGFPKLHYCTLYQNTFNSIFRGLTDSENVPHTLGILVYTLLHPGPQLISQLPQHCPHPSHSLHYVQFDLLPKSQREGPRCR